jgi:hypothetical protein
MKIVGMKSFTGRSITLLAMKYDESLYMHEDLSFIIIARSSGNVKRD